MCSDSFSDVTNLDLSYKENLKFSLAKSVISQFRNIEKTSCFVFGGVGGGGGGQIYRLNCEIRPPSIFVKPTTQVCCILY